MTSINAETKPAARILFTLLNPNLLWSLPCDGTYVSKSPPVCHLSDAESQCLELHVPAEAFIYVAMARLMVRRLART